MPTPQPAILGNLEEHQWYVHLSREKGADLGVIKRALQNLRGDCAKQKVNLGHWYGLKDRKWMLLSEYAWANGYGPLVSRCTTPYLEGLLEWRMSVEAAERAIEAERPARLLRLRYEDLIADPVAQCRSMQEFLGLAPDAGLERYAAEQVRRQNPAAAQREVPAETEEIAGDTLRRMGYRF